MTTNQTQTTIISSAEVTTQKAALDKSVKSYYECEAVEQTLHTQIKEALEPKYLDTLRNVDKDMIYESIPEIFIFLKETYGRITEEELIEKEDAPNNNETDKQLVQVAYLIFNRTRIIRGYTQKVK